METNEIVKALRCSAQIPSNEEQCAGCPYFVLEHPSEDDVKELGLEPEWQWKSCNVDRMALDAADLIEKQDVEIKALRGAANSLKAALSAMEQDLRQAVSGLDCELCAHFCNDGKPVYRPDEGYLAYCEKCGGDFCCFEWRGIQGTEELK